MANSSESPANRPPLNVQRRTVPRYSFIATAEIVEPISGVRMSGRISEISRKGCYVDILNGLPKDTSIQVHISRDQGAFTSAGKIIYVHEQMGVGVVFVNPPADQAEILEKWLAELSASE